MKTALTDPTMLLRRSLIIFRMDQEDQTLDFWFTRLESVLTNVHAYERDPAPMLHLYAIVGNNRLADDGSQTQRAVTIETTECFADFYPVFDALSPGARIPIAPNYHIYTFLSQ